MALPAHSTDLTEDQQVMNAQATGPGVLEGETRGPDYGAAGHQLPNGVARPEPSPVSLESLPWGSPPQEPGRATGAVDRAEPSALELPIPSRSVETASYSSTGIGGDMVGRPEPRAPEWPPALRWMSRLNDFFQRATTGSVEMITAHTSQQVSGSREGGVVVQQHTYRAQQALTPQHVTQQQRSLLREDRAGDPPLFGPDAQRTMEEWPLRAPLLHGHSRLPPAMATEGSDRASSTSIPREMVQDEVRRQVVEAMRAQNEQLERLKRENEALRAMRPHPPGLPPPPQLPQGDRASEQQLLLRGDRASEQQPLLRGDRASEQQPLLRGDRASEQQPLLRGDRASEQQPLLRGDRASEQQPLLRGDRASEQQLLPPGDRASEQLLLPGDRALEQHPLLRGDRASEQQPLLRGDRASEQQPLLRGDRASEQQPLLRGDRASEQQSLPPGDRALEQQGLLQGDRALSGGMQSLHGGDIYGSGPCGVRFEGHDQMAEERTEPHPFGGLLQGDANRASKAAVPPVMPSPPGPTRGDYGQRGARNRSGSREKRAGDGAKATPPPPPQASSSSQPTSPLETLVAGMAQIQQVLLKGKGVADSSDYDPSKAVAEFPKLAENTVESGAIDFQDWLYLVEQQVGSLASGASTWWAGMLEAAMKAYGKYQSATPIQRLAIVSELPEEWEDVKYSKLEKRVAALLVGALPQQMKEEMVSYRVRRVHQPTALPPPCQLPAGRQLGPRTGPSSVGAERQPNRGHRGRSCPETVVQMAAACSRSSAVAARPFGAGARLVVDHEKARRAQCRSPI